MILGKRGRADIDASTHALRSLRKLAEMAQFSLRCALTLIGLFVVFAWQSAHAQERKKRIVRIEIAASPAASASLEAVLRDVLSGLDVSPEMTVVPRIDATNAVLGPPGDPTVLLGRAFLDLSDPGRATVYLVDAKWERILIRHVPGTANSEILHETVGRIVSTGVEALLAGSFGELSRPVERAPPPLTPRPPNPTPIPIEAKALESPREPALRSRLGAMYEGELYSSAKPFAHGPGLAGAVEFGGRALRPALFITAQYRLPILDSDPPVGLRLDTTAVRVLAGFALDLRAALALEVGIGLGLDVMHLAPRLATADGSSYATPERWFATGLGRAMIGARWSATRALSLQAALIVDIDVSGSRLTVDESTGRIPVIAPYPLRPGLALGVSLP